MVLPPRCFFCRSGYPRDAVVLNNPIALMGSVCAGTSSYVACLHQKLLAGGHKVDTSFGAFARMTRALAMRNARPDQREEWAASDMLGAEVFRPFAFDWGGRRLEIVVGPFGDGSGQVNFSDVWSDVLSSCQALMISMRARDLRDVDEHALRIDQRAATRIRDLVANRAPTRSLTIVFNACDEVADGPERAEQWTAHVMNTCFKTTTAVCIGHRIHLRGVAATTWGFGQSVAGPLRFPVHAAPWNILETLQAPTAALVDKTGESVRPRNTPTAERIDVALSFASEQRTYVDEVARHLFDMGLRVFYDKTETANLWGEDLSENLAAVYGRTARYVVVFISKEYRAKSWTMQELAFARSRESREQTRTVLPVRFDETEIPGMQETLAFVDARKISPHGLAKLIAQKVSRSGA